MDWARLASSDAAGGTVCYRSAKIVLVGDTGVGKSGLGAVLAGHPFEPTESTHGRKIWLFESKREPLQGGGHQAREVMLWDLAGQPGYRLVHQLNIDQAVAALVLVDARSETDPLGPAEYWARAIDQARSSIRITKFLVVARIDRGGLAVGTEGLKQFAQRFGFSAVFQTSAKTGEGVGELTQAIRQAIRSDDLEEVTSTSLFTGIKRFLEQEKARGDKALVEKVEVLFQRFCSRSSSEANLDEFRTCIRRLEDAGLVEVLRFTTLDESSDEKAEYILLQPEYVDAYASAAVMTARDDPRGIGHVLESELLAGRLRLDKGERIPDERVERLVLAVTIERLLNHDIALRERLADGDYLVFPSEYTRTAPYPRRNAPGVAFDFQGAIRAIFTTLVVRLAHHRDFSNVEFYRDAASYDTVMGGRCAVVLDETAPGQGRMNVYFEDNPSQVEQQGFLRFVRLHLETKAKPESVHLHRLYFCRACGQPFAESAIENRLKLGRRDIGCENCDERSPLFDVLIAEDLTAQTQAQTDARLIDSDADIARRRQLASTAIEGKKRIGEYDVFLSYHTKDRGQVVELAEALVALGIRPWLDVWDLVPGRPWQAGLTEAMESVNAVAVCVGSGNLGPWQDHEVMAFIRKFVSRKSPVIPLLLPGASSEIVLPLLLESFHWVDMRQFSLVDPRPLANLVAGIFGRRPRLMDPGHLAEQVAAILGTGGSKLGTDDGQEIVLPVNRTSLDEIELEAVRQQTARLLGIPSERLKLKGTRSGSVKVVLVVKDLNAVSQLFAMVHRSDATLQEFFQRCQIDQDQFTKENDVTAQRVKQEVQARQSEQDDSDTLISLTSVPEDEFKKWTGGANILTVAVVFTDIVDSTKLCNDLGDAAWEEIRQRHFALAVRLVQQKNGILIKNLGDGILALFHDATAAVGFAIALHHDTGHAVVRIRAGVHVGQVSAKDGDAFGRHMNLAARVMGYAKANGVIVSNRIKEDIDHRGEPWSKNLRWVEFPGVTLKGFPEPETLWGVEAVT